MRELSTNKRRFSFASFLKLAIVVTERMHQWPLKQRFFMFSGLWWWGGGKNCCSKERSNNFCDSFLYHCKIAATSATHFLLNLDQRVAATGCSDDLTMFLSFSIWTCIQEKCHQYWPSERSARYQYYVVDPMAEYNMPQYILREFKITDARVLINSSSLLYSLSFDYSFKTHTHTASPNISRHCFLPFLSTLVSTPHFDLKVGALGDYSSYLFELCCRVLWCSINILSRHLMTVVRWGNLGSIFQRKIWDVLYHLCSSFKFRTHE